MTDDEIKLYLRPRHNWVAICAFALALLGSAAAAARWAFTAPTREDYDGLSNRTRTVETDHAVLKAGVEGMRNDLADVKASTKDINATLMQLQLTRRNVGR